jgi:hypothetical protein
MNGPRGPAVPRLNGYILLGISFAVFVEECHGNIASSTIIDCTIKRFSWRTLTWRLLSCHPLGCLSWAYLRGYSQHRQQTFSVLACGWAVAGGERQTITTSLWLTGATRVKHCSRFYVFLGAALYQARWPLWARIIHCAAQWVPEAAPSVIVVDDSAKKKAGRQIEGVGHYRNGAGSARQEYRTLRGLNFVGGSCG